jgi:hypothetical protein
MLMIKRFDHLTIVVDDLVDAKRFFGLLGFTEAMSVVISGPTMASYMGVADIVADHVTLVAEGVRRELKSNCYTTGSRPRSTIPTSAICTRSA